MRLDPDKVRKKDGKARKPIKVDVSGGYSLNSDYRLQLCSGRPIGNTGLLVIFEIIPKFPTLPRFIGRWDEKADVLDVDIQKVSKAEGSKFKRGRGGYSGHHPAIISKTDREFHVNVQYCSNIVFDGVISFGLHRELELSDTEQIVDKGVHKEII